MNTYILVGEMAVDLFENQRWGELEELLFLNQNGDILAWDNATESVSTLLDILSGWSEFVELTKEDLDDIRENTKIEIV